MQPKPYEPPHPVNAETFQNLAAALRPVAETQPELLGLYLFGSQATGEAREGSDYDLGALFRHSPQVLDLVGLQGQLSEALGSDVDLIDVGSASPYLALDVVRGERLYCQDPDACDAFDLYVLRRAADLAPFERQRRQMILGLGTGPETNE